MPVIGEHFIQFGFGQVVLVLLQIQFSQLHAGARIGMIFQHPLPGHNRRVGIAQNRLRLGQGHHGMAIVMLRLFCANLLQQRSRLFRFLFPQQALA